MFSVKNCAGLFGEKLFKLHPSQNNMMAEISKTIPVNCKLAKKSDFYYTRFRTVEE